MPIECGCLFCASFFLHRRTCRVDRHTYSSHLALLFVCVFSPSTRLGCSTPDAFPFWTLFFSLVSLCICSVPAAASAPRRRRRRKSLGTIQKEKRHIYNIERKAKGGNSIIFSPFPSVLVSSQSTTEHQQGAPPTSLLFSPAAKMHQPVTNRFVRLLFHFFVFLLHLHSEIFKTRGLHSLSRAP